mmetsp:Transcript_1681/g.2682  ORF Transcript_1681/g.2682 Transcript_1681/m.2682 type:complete len:114 (-) Transcript_1681:77-418(-)
MNNGQGAEATSAATKHRDPKTMLGYVRADDTLLMKAALGIGASMKRASCSTRIAGVEFENDEEAEKRDSCSNFASRFDATADCSEDQEEADEPEVPSSKMPKLTTTTMSKFMN